MCGYICIFITRNSGEKKRHTDMQEEALKYVCLLLTPSLFQNHCVLLLIVCSFVCALASRAMSGFRRFNHFNAYKCSSSSLVSVFRGARKLIRRASLAIQGDIDANRYVLELSYGVKGRFRHVLDRNNNHNSKEKEKINSNGNHDKNQDSNKKAKNDLIQSIQYIPSYYHYGMNSQRNSSNKGRISSVVQYRADWENDHMNILQESLITHDS